MVKRLKQTHPLQLLLADSTRLQLGEFPTEARVSAGKAGTTSEEALQVRQSRCHSVGSKDHLRTPVTDFIQEV